MLFNDNKTLLARRNGYFPGFIQSFNSLSPNSTFKTPFYKFYPNLANRLLRVLQPDKASIDSAKSEIKSKINSLIISINTRTVDVHKNFKSKTINKSLFPVFIDKLLDVNKEAVKYLALKKENFISDLLHTKMIFFSNEKEVTPQLFAPLFALEETVKKLSVFKQNNPNIRIIHLLEKEINENIYEKIELYCNDLAEKARAFTFTQLQQQFITLEVHTLLTQLNMFCEKLDALFNNPKTFPNDIYLMNLTIAEFNSTLREIKNEIDGIIPRYRLVHLNEILNLLTPHEQELSFEHCIRAAADDFTPKTPLLDDIPEESLLMVERILEIYPEFLNVPDQWNNKPITDSLKNAPHRVPNDTYPYFDFLQQRGAQLSLKPFQVRDTPQTPNYPVTLFSGARTSAPSDNPNWPMRKCQQITEKARKKGIQGFLSQKALLSSENEYKE